MKISVGIPTIAGRQKYLASALRTCCTQEDPDLEILVSDNSGGDARELVESLGDPRVRYIRPDRYLPMSAHWDFMVSHFTGELVTIIGDDDGLMPGSLRRVRELATQYPGMPIQHSLANYCWPDFPVVGDQNKLWFMHEPGRAVEVVASADFLKRLARAAVRYSDGPMIYHNFVPGELVRRLSATGDMFHRACPDVYSAITVAAHTPNFVRTQEVLTLAGQGARSNGASARQEGKDADRFLEEMRTRYTPRFGTLTLHLHTLDSIIEASERYGLPRLLDDIHWGEQFCGAANECLDFPGRSLPARQLLGVVREAVSHGALGYLLRNRGAELLRKVGARLTLRPPSARRTDRYAPGVRSAVPAQVRDVYAASLHLRELLP